MQYLNAVVHNGKIALKSIHEDKRDRRLISYEPSLFIPSKDGLETKWKTYTNKTFVDKVKFSSISEARKFVREYGEISNFPIYGNTRYEYAFLSDFCDRNHKDLPDLDAVRLAYFDIEVSCEDGLPDIKEANNPITSICLYLDQMKKFIVFGCKDYTAKDKNVMYVKCDNEHMLLEKFLKVWSNADFDVISGWNSSFFDLPYLYNRMCKLFDDKFANRLSPWNKVSKRTVIIFNKEHESIDILGIDSLDYLDLYKKFVLPASSVKPENNKLNTVAHYELGIKKVDYSEYQSLDDLYEKDYKKFIDYNVQDVQILVDLESKLKIIKMCLQLAYDARVNFQDVFSQVRMWDSIIFNHLKSKNCVIPFKQDFDKEEKYEGAFVKEPQLGLHEWICSFDLDSLYPNLILQYNISPETIVKRNKENSFDINTILDKKIPSDKLRDRNLCISGSGHFFRVDEDGFLPEIIGPMYQQRKDFKKKAGDGKQFLKQIEEELQRRGL